MIIADFFFWSSILILLYIYLGYPLVLIIVEKFIPRRPVLETHIQPNVSLVISAYNEEKIIGKKIENCLSLDYPTDKLEIIVVSDASTDKTDTIVKSYREKGVILKRMHVRGGKTAGLNETIPLAGGDIIVFSDANALYAPNAIKKLVRNFRDTSGLIPELHTITKKNAIQRQLLAFTFGLVVAFASMKLLG
jgi:cellulose synthase/poly-beta-1,6-N-acetylglucosamine synthase-like glycosyltransferase